MYYVTMQITFLSRKFRNVERNLHCDVVHITTKWVSSLTLDCNGVFAIKAYSVQRAIVNDIVDEIVTCVGRYIRIRQEALRNLSRGNLR